MNNDIARTIRRIKINTLDVIKIEDANRRLRQLAESTARSQAYKWKLERSCTIPDGQEIRKAHIWADQHWRTAIPEEYRDLFE